MNTGMRITTNAMIRRYSNNLNNALADLDATRNTVASGRNFNKIAEDPASAMKSFKLWSNYQRTEVQKANTVDSLKKLEEVTTNVQGCTSMGRKFIEKSLLSYSDPNSAFESRQAYKQEVDKLVDSFLQQANGRYNENFIFGGASTKDLPFEKIDDVIYYRGVPVNTPDYLTRDQLSNILSKPVADGGKFGLADTVTATNPPLTTTLNTIMGASSTGTTSIPVKELYNQINTLADPYKTDLLKDDMFQFSGIQIKTMLSKAGLNNLPDDTGYDPFDTLASVPSLEDAYQDITGGISDSDTMTYQELIDAIDAYTLPAGATVTTLQADLKNEVENASSWNEEVSADTVKTMLTDVGLKDAATGTTPQLSEVLNEIMGKDADTISYDKIEKAIDAVPDALLSESQKYQLKAVDDVSYQLKYNTYFNEHSYRDIGFGMKEKYISSDKNSEIVSTSAFDTAVNGLEVFGYGVDEDGLPNNIIALAQELSKTLAVDDISDLDFEKHNKIIDKMRQSYDDMVDNGLAALGTKCAFLENTEDQLTQTSQTLNEQISDLDFCDPAEAIMNLMWSQYTYNATLKVGNTLLSNSFIDFMS